MNNLAELLSSPPDEISELNGVELVRQKVAADENFFNKLTKLGDAIDISNLKLSMTAPLTDSGRC